MILIDLFSLNLVISWILFISDHEYLSTDLNGVYFDLFNIFIIVDKGIIFDLIDR